MYIRGLGSPVTPYQSGYPCPYCLVLIRGPLTNKGKGVLLGHLVAIISVVITNRNNTHDHTEDKTTSQNYQTSTDTS